MREVVSADLLLGRDTLSPGLLKAGRAAADASGNMRQLTRDIYEVSKARATPVIDLKDAAAKTRLDEVAQKLRDLSARTAQARVDVADKDALAKLAGMRVRLDDLGKKVSSPRVTLEGLARAEAGIAALDAQLDRLGRKDVHPKIKVEESGLQRLRNISAGPSLIAGIGPAAIPAAAGLIPVLGAVTASFGAATVAAGVFGLMAKSTLAQAAKDAKKLSDLQMKLQVATTAKQKETIRQHITAIEAGQGKAYGELLKGYAGVINQWDMLSKKVTIPVLVPWIKDAALALSHLRPAIEPVAKLFRAWGDDIHTYLASRQGSAELQRMARAFGTFSTTQLGDIGTFLFDIARGVFNLGRDLASYGVDFSTFGTHVQDWGDAFQTWSKSAAARRDVGDFLRFVHREGPQVGQFLKAAGMALKNIAPGLTSAGQLELRALTSFLTMVAKLPPRLATQLTEMAVGALALAKPVGMLASAGASLGKLPGLLRKIGILGPSAAAGGMQKAGDTMVAASANMQKAADTMAGATIGVKAEGAAVGGAAGGAAGGGILRRIFGKAFGGTLRVLGAFLVTELLIKPTLQSIPQDKKAGTSFWDRPSGTGPKGTSGWESWRQLFRNIGLTSGKAFSGGLDDGTERGVVSRFLPYVKTIPDATRKAVSPGFTAIRDIADEKATAMKAAVLKQFGATGAQIRDTLSRMTRATGVSFSDIRDMASEKAGAMKAAVTGHFDTMRSRASGTVDRLHDHVTRQFGAMDSKVASLSKTLENIPRHVSTSISVSGTGSWHLTRVGTGIFAGKQLAAGGMIQMGSGPMADDVPIMASRGEYVVNAASTAKYRPLIEAINAQHLAGGGVVGSYHDGPSGERAWAVRELRASERAIASGLARAIAQATSLFAGGAGMASSGLVRMEQQYAASLFGRYGWGPAQLPPLIALWNRESGWNPWAVNRSSGAYGIPQALGHGHPFDLGDWPAQIGWGEGYIAGRYGSPAGAWGHEQAVGWYGRGGLVRGYADGGLVAPGARTWSVGAVPATERAPVSLPGSSLARMQAAAHAALAALQKNEVADYAGLRHAFRVSLLGSEHTARWLRAHKHGAAAAWAASHPAARAWLALPRHRRWARAGLEHLARLQERETAAFKAIAGGDVTFGNLAALARAVGLESAGLRGMGALSHVPGGHPGWVSGVAWWLRGLGAAAGTARAALGAQFHVYDSGGWLPPGATVAVNRTGRPEMVVPASRGTAPTVVVNMDVRVAPGAHPAEVGRQVAGALNEYFRGGGKISNGRGKSFP